MTQPCLNCNTLLQDDYRYCPQCSQKAHLHRLSLHDVIHDAIHYFTHADKGLFALIKDLFTRNGNVARAYVAGKRKSIFPPLNFYLIVATLIVIVVQFIRPDVPFDVQKSHPELQTITDETRRAKLTAIYERQHKGQKFTDKYSNVLMMVSLPLVALWYWIFYKRAKYNYTEHLVACMYMVGFANLFYAAVFVPVMYFAGIKESSKTGLVFVVVFMALQAIYHSIFYYRFMDKRTARSAWKASIVSVFVLLFWLVVTTIIMAVYVATGFRF